MALAGSAAGVALPDLWRFYVRHDPKWWGNLHPVLACAVEAALPELRLLRSVRKGGALVTVERVGASRDGVRYDVSIDNFLICFLVLHHGKHALMVSKAKFDGGLPVSIPSPVFRAARLAALKQHRLDRRQEYANHRHRRAQLSLF